MFEFFSCHNSNPHSSDIEDMEKIYLNSLVFELISLCYHTFYIRASLITIVTHK